LENEVKKLSFFKRVKIAIFNLEEYKIFAKEKFSQSFKYFLLLITILTFILSVSSTIEKNNQLNKLVNYIKNDFPNFNYSDGKLSVEQKTEAFDEQYQSKLIVDTDENITDETVDFYKKDIRDSEYSLILLKEKAILTISGVQYEQVYSELSNTFGIANTNKQEMIDQYFNDKAMKKIVFSLWVYSFVYTFVWNFLNILMDVIIVSIFGWVASKIVRVNIGILNVMSLSIYSLTLSMILDTIYTIVYAFSNFEIKYFAVLYMIISYIYIIASIMILKEDSNKGVGDVVTVDGQVIKENDDFNNQEDNLEENKNDKKKPEKDDKENESNEELPTDEIPKDNKKNSEDKINNDEKKDN